MFGITLEEIERIATPYIRQPYSYVITRNDLNLYKRLFLIYLTKTGCYHPITKIIYRPATMINRPFYEFAISNETDIKGLNEYCNELSIYNINDLNALIDKEYVTFLTSLRNSQIK